MNATKLLIYKFLLNFFKTVFFLGYIKYFPGTYGSIFSTVVFYLFFTKLFVFFYQMPLLSFAFWNCVILIFYAASCIFSVYCLNLYFKIFKPQKLDSQEIVIDEFLGQFLLCYLIFMLDVFFNLGFFQNLLLYLIFSVLIFRYFDILKPFPINIIDSRLKSAWGVVLDDLVAAFLSILCIVTYVIILKNF